MKTRFTLKTLNRILKTEVSENLELVKGKGYFYFVYDDGNNVHLTHSVMVYRLNDLSIREWRIEGRDFMLKNVEIIAYD